MNEQQIQRSERIASKVMRFLAVTGLVAVLALIAWLIVQGIRIAPNMGERMSAAVTAVTSVFRSAPEEDIVFDLATRTLTSGQPVVVRWSYTGEADEPTRFSYDCTRNVSLSLEVNGGWQDLACGEERALDGAMVTVIPTSPESRFADVTLHVKRGGVEDATLVTVVNTDIDSLSGVLSVAESEEVEEEKAGETTSEDAAPEEPAPAPATIAPSTPSPTTAPVAAPAPRVLAPADLVVNIEETGVYVDVAGRNTFFPISPVPSDKRAGVVFTVTNRGEQPSGPWGFTANLPIEGDMKYRYNSPLQGSLAPGMQVEFTLGFDEVIDAGKGLIRIEIIPTGTDNPGNNVDAAIIEFK